VGVGGLISLVGGLTGEVAGGIATTTGIGAAVGVPAIAVSTTLVVGGVGNIAAGIRGLSQFKRAMGPGKNWHHVVEQTPANVAKFGPNRSTPRRMSFASRRQSTDRSVATTRRRCPART
jgi:hypothetical protein